MNLNLAREILDLPEDFTPELLKKNYRKLAKEFHPDKNPNGSEKFLKVGEAYNFLLNYKEPNPDDIFENLFNFSDILKSCNAFRQTNFSFKKEIKEISISPLEYFTGCNKEIKVPNVCNCEMSICKLCSGGGYTLNGLALEVCMDCLGNGCKCNCPKFKEAILTIPAFVNLDTNIITDHGLFKIKLNDNRYKIINNKICYLFDITLKESLVGFTKTFKDPFGKEHLITIKNSIIKQNDGYNLTSIKLILLFNIIFPDKLSKKAINLLKNVEF